METFIVLLRGINVSGQKKVVMSELRKMLEDNNFKEVQTYIQSGNVVLKSKEADCSKIAAKIKKELLNYFGFDVSVLVKTHLDLKHIFKENPYTDAADIEAKKVYFAFLEKAPNPELFCVLSKMEFANEQFVVTDTCVYLNYLNGAGKAKLTNNLIEKKLQISATSRNYRTITKLLEMSE